MDDAKKDEAQALHPPRACEVQGCQHALTCLAAVASPAGVRGAGIGVRSYNSTGEVASHAGVRGAGGVTLQFRLTDDSCIPRGRARCRARAREGLLPEILGCLRCRRGRRRPGRGLTGGRPQRQQRCRCSPAPTSPAIGFNAGRGADLRRDGPPGGIAGGRTHPLHRGLPDRRARPPAGPTDRAGREERPPGEGRKDCHAGFGSATAARTLPGLAGGEVRGRHLTSHRAAHGHLCRETRSPLAILVHQGSDPTLPHQAFG